MSIVNQLDCSKSAGNIARPNCDYEPGLEIGGIFGPRRSQFTLAELASEDAFRAALIARSQADNPLERIVAVGPYQAWASSGEAKVEQTYASGLKRERRRATMQHDLTIVDSLCYYNQVERALHNKHSYWGYWFVRQQGNRYAVHTERAVDGSGNEVVQFFDLNSLSIGLYNEATENAGNDFVLTRGLSSPQAVYGNYSIIMLDFNPLDVITGLANVELKGRSIASNVVRVSGKVGCGTVDLHDLYGSDLADVDAFKVYNAEAGTANYGNEITLASVAEAGNEYLLTLAASGVDTDNPGTGKKVSVRIAAPSDLAALTPAVEGIESETIIVTLF